jgi:hypothetical protein
MSTPTPGAVDGGNNASQPPAGGSQAGTYCFQMVRSTMNQQSPYHGTICFLASGVLCIPTRSSPPVLLSFTKGSATH